MTKNDWNDLADKCEKTLASETRRNLDARIYAAVNPECYQNYSKSAPYYTTFLVDTVECIREKLPDRHIANLSDPDPIYTTDNKSYAVLCKNDFELTSSDTELPSEPDTIRLVAEGYGNSLELALCAAFCRAMAEKIRVGDIDDESN